MFGDYFQEETDQAVAASISALKPPPPPKKTGGWNGWSAPLRGVAAGASEVAASVREGLKGFGQVTAATGAYSAGGMFSTQSDTERAESQQQRERIATEGVDTSATPLSQSLREASRYYKPDPSTATMAEQLTFDLTRFVTKAVGYSVAGGGPVAGAALTGVDEGMTVAEDLAQAGVDRETRNKVGAVAGVASALGVALPVAAPGSILGTSALVLAGGPGAFVAQQAATREILNRADYGDLAQQYDPLDPVGLAVSTLVPAGFGAWAMRGARRPAPSKPVESTALPEANLTPDQVDAVMTHNLSLADDVHESTQAPEISARMERPAPFEPARNLTDDQRAVEQRFADRVMSDVDGALAEYALNPETHGGKVVNTDLFRELSPDYAGSKEGRSKYAAAVHEPSSWMAREQYSRLLAREPETGSVLVLGGGGGSGKSTSMDVVAPGYAARHDAIYDTTLANEYRANEAIKAALDSGRTVEIVYVARDPMESIVNGVIPRAERDGRTVPLSVAAAAHRDAPRTLYGLIERYADDDRVTIRIIDNTGAPGSQRALTEMPVFDYNGLVERVHDAADKLYEQRQLSQATYDGLVAGRPSQADARRGQAEPDVRRTGEQPSPQHPGRQPAGSAAPEGGVKPGSGAEAANDAAPTAADPNSPQALDSEPSGHRDPLTRSVLDRAADLERTSPDMVVRQDENGRDVTVREEMERIRRESIEGTDTELGSQDAPLVEVAANCALSTGAG